MSKRSATRFRIGDDELAVISAPLTPELPESLTPAEHAVVTLVFAGHSNAAIAGIRGVAVRTIANQIASAMRKLGVCSRAELVARLAR